MKTPSSETVGSRIRDRRAALGWTQQDLAVKAGIFASTVSKIELNNGYRKTTIESIARAMGVAASSLIPDETTTSHAGKGGKRARRAAGNVPNSAKTSRQRSQGPTAKRAEKAA